MIVDTRDDRKVVYNLQLFYRYFNIANVILRNIKYSIVTAVAVVPYFNLANVLWEIALIDLYTFYKKHYNVYKLELFRCNFARDFIIFFNILTALVKSEITKLHLVCYSTNISVITVNNNSFTLFTAFLWITAACTRIYFSFVTFRSSCIYISRTCIRVVFASKGHHVRMWIFPQLSRRTDYRRSEGQSVRLAAWLNWNTILQNVQANSDNIVSDINVNLSPTATLYRSFYQLYHMLLYTGCKWIPVTNL